MKNMLQKSASLLLALAMIVSLLPNYALAEENEKHPREIIAEERKKTTPDEKTLIPQEGSGLNNGSESKNDNSDLLESYLANSKSCDHSGDTNKNGYCSVCNDWLPYKDDNASVQLGIYEAKKDTYLRKHAYEVSNKDHGEAAVSFKTGSTIEVTGAVVNALGKTWYKVDYNGELRYVYSGNVEYKSAPLECCLHIAGFVDGELSDSTEGFGTFDVYINGKQIKNDVTAFNTRFTKGTEYEINDIKLANFSTFDGVDGAELKGTLSEDIHIILIFNKKLNIIAETFPDANFRAYVSKEFDADSNGYLNNAEINEVKYIFCNYSNITSFKGIEFFPALCSLQARGNNLTELDVSKNLALLNLYCDGNQLTTLDVSKNLALLNLDCNGNQLTTLDVSKNIALNELCCYENKLTALDVSKNTALEQLWCSDNPLGKIDVSKNTKLKCLYCCSNQLTSLDLHENVALRTLDCGDNQLTELDISRNKLLDDIQFYKNQIKSIDISDKPELDTLDCSNNQLTSLDVSNNKELYSLICGNNHLTKLDVSANTMLNQLWCDNNQITSLDVSNNKALVELICWNNQLTKLNVNNNNKLNHLSCDQNQITYLDVSTNTALERLWCAHNNLEMLDVTKNTLLWQLGCEGNMIEELNISRCPELVALYQNTEAHEHDWWVNYYSGEMEHQHILSFDADVSVIAGGSNEPFDNVSLSYRSSANEIKSLSGLKFDMAWFSQNSYTYNHELAKMSLGLCMAGFEFDEPYVDNGDERIKALYQELGFGTYQAINYGDQDKDTVAMALAVRKIYDTNGKPIPLIAVELRGSGYGNGGWAGNFEIGKNQAYHAGFEKAARYALKEVNKYLNSDEVNNYFAVNGLNRSNARFWITGFSRSAATANLLSQFLRTDGGINSRYIYTYTFATPNNQQTYKKWTDSAYENIFNILNPIDLVPMVPPTNWLMGKLGTTYRMPLFFSRTEENFAAFQSTFTQLSDAKYTYSERQPEQMRTLLDTLVGTIYSREEYVKDLQEQLVEYARGNYTPIDEILHLTTYEHLVTLLESAGNSAASARAEFLTGQARLAVVDASMAGAKYGMVASELAAVIAYRKVAYGRNDPYLSILRSAWEMIKELAGEYSKILNLQFPEPTVADYTINLLVKGVESDGFMQHWPETYMAGMMNCNEYEMRKTNEFITKMLTVRCPVDVEVYDEAGNLVARTLTDTYSVTDEETGEVYTGTFTKVDENVTTLETIILGEGKNFLLPDDQEYRIVICTNDTYEDGDTMSYSVTEYAGDSAVSAVIYDAVVLEEGANYESEVVVSDEQVEKCTLSCDGELLEPTEIISSNMDGIAIDETSFPDEVFRTYVSENFDADGDEYLCEKEIEAVTYIDCAEQEITSLQGVEVFRNLEYLYCEKNQLTELDVSSNIKLIDLWCHENELPELDVSKNTALETLYCNNNKLTEIDVSKNTALKIFSCANNQLTTLDVSKNTALTRFNFGGNSISKIDLSKNAVLSELLCWGNQLTALDVSQNTALTELYCQTNPLTTLDLSGNTALTGLCCYEDQLIALDLSNNTELEWITCIDNQLTKLDVCRNTKLYELGCYHNQIAELNISRCPKLIEALATEASTNDGAIVYNNYEEGMADEDWRYLAFDEAVTLITEPEPIELLVENNKVEVQVAPLPNGEQGTVFCAGYDSSGKMLWIRQESLAGNAMKTVTYDLQDDTVTIKAMVVDDSLTPLFEAATWTQGR